MVLELSQQQIHVLHACLSESIAELHDEVLHTDERALREALKLRLDQLQGIQQQVEALMQAQEGASPG
ncbi:MULTISPECIES: hypothetical protein [Myxococcus]|uniref:Uncharacterized protein n=1 Tax=Myxococcus xanthus TaxID=34 RepID=A0AAE6KRD8_MYXXA|nr:MULTISPECIES: hypothetical protein [Myxococcus]QDE67015.1 hypothetical protein BHS09_08325 [Myxococcus xanthus]QDE74288.1 hypothetical protein BHS08_08330 [Myxococcus xanthus]QDE95882.1 hypothetical protein BHS05_08345 [Myxococcus xanthus]WAM28129.1 hypothetical protein OZ403_08370 [Myxococcus sp. NMCA1]